MRIYPFWKKNIKPVKFIRPASKIECCAGCTKSEEQKLEKRFNKAVEVCYSISWEDAIDKTIAMQEVAKIRAEISEYVGRVYG